MKFNLAFALAALALFPYAAKPVEGVVFVSKTHLDLGFAILPHEVVEQFRTHDCVIDSASAKVYTSQ